MSSHGSGNNYHWPRIFPQGVAPQPSYGDIRLRVFPQGKENAGERSPMYKHSGGRHRVQKYCFCTRCLSPFVLTSRNAGVPVKSFLRQIFFFSTFTMVLNAVCVLKGDGSVTGTVNFKEEVRHTSYCWLLIFVHVKVGDPFSYMGHGTYNSQQLRFAGS